MVVFNSLIVSLAMEPVDPYPDAWSRRMLPALQLPTFSSRPARYSAWTESWKRWRHTWDPCRLWAPQASELVEGVRASSSFQDPLDEIAQGEPCPWVSCPLPPDHQNRTAWAQHTPSLQERGMNLEA